MAIKLTFVTAVIAFMSAAAPACADRIDLGKFTGQTQGKTLNGLTTDAVGYTITLPYNNFQLFTQGKDLPKYDNIFNGGDPVLYTNGSGLVSIDFDSAINSLSGLSLACEDCGAYTGDFTFYSGSTKVGDVERSGATGDAPGTAPNYSFTGAAFDRVVLSLASDRDASLIASTVSPTPEPAAWMTMILGLGAVGFIAWRRKRSAHTAFPSMSPA